MDPREYDWQMGDLADQSNYPPGVDPSAIGTAVKNWWSNQPSWAERAKAENQRTAEAFQRGGMGEIAKQLATDTTEAQDLVSAFGVGNIKGVRPPVAPGALAAVSEYRPPFYSAVEQAVQGAKQNAAPGQQWAGFLRNQPGVKPEEVEALGLGKLFEQPGSVPKEAVLGEIAANRVSVGEVYKGARSLPSAQEAQELAGLEQRFVNKDMTLNAQDADRLTELKMKRDQLPDAFQPTHYGPDKAPKLTLPGGENYREMLLTLPRQGRNEAEWARGLEINKQIRSGAVPPAELPRLQQELASIVEKDNRAMAGEFKSSHYDEPNILAHVRYNDRVIDGKKTLFVEEVQSDWHQKGKREGYARTPERDREDFKKWAADKGILAAKDPARADEWVTNNMQPGSSYLNQFKYETGFGGGVPDAPFKTTWPELAMKRIIREAAEKGYDKVAWTPGSVQAERYDLSKHVKKIDYNPESGKLWGYDHTGTTVMDTRINSDKLADYIGKDASEKLLKTQADKGWHRLEGTDLKIGGEGMKGFYDEILPATVNKLVKKHGGRVGQGEIPTEVQKPTAYRDFEEYADMRRKEKEGKLPKQPVHTLDITPSLRAAAMKGFPLFSAGGVAATGAMGELARQDDYRQ